MSASAEITYDLSLLEKSRERWRTHAGLRAVYADIYRDMLAESAPGPSLELGSGCSTMREIVPGVVTSDVQHTPFVDLAVSAYAIEEAPGGPWGTIYLLDVLHHLREPMRFFASAARALRPGGRVVIADPAATPGGRVFYSLCHHEPIVPARIHPPYSFPPDSPDGTFANMAMAWVLFGRDAAEIHARLAGFGLAVRAVRFRDLLAYPATGGFSGPRLLPAPVLRGLLAIERTVPKVILEMVALRMVVVLERVGEAGGEP